MPTVHRIHIVGSARSGTTLALEAVYNAFEIDRYVPEERPVLSTFGTRGAPDEVLLSKSPQDHAVAARLIEREPDLYWICLIRDPRDVIVSRHRRAPDRYYTTLSRWKRAWNNARKLQNHPRFVILRYETLVRDPAAAERMLLERIPFLRSKKPLAEAMSGAKPSEQSLVAMHGLRPIDDASIGRWREHKPRVAGQIRHHGPITDELIELGYEPDDTWLAELEGVEPDLEYSVLEEFPSLRRRLGIRYRGFRRWMRYFRRRRRTG